MPSAFSVANSPLTANGTLAVTGAGTTAQYVRGDGSLATFPTVASEAQRLITEVYNETGATLTKGTIVYINGGHGNLPTVTKAIATGDATSAQTYGVVQSDITNNNNGFVVVIGSLTDINTFGLSAGQALYLSSTTAGEWTPTKQYAPAHLVYIATVTRVHPTQGIVEVRIQNGYEMDELHNVSAQSPSNGDILQFNYSTQLWTKTAGTTTNIAEGTNLYYTSARFNSAFSSKTTSDLTEGTNLYYTASRFNSAFSAKTTSDLTEGTNLYFTNARAQAAITLTTTGSSGAATYIGGTLNIPDYGSALSGYLPLSGGTLTGDLYGTTATFSGVVSAKGSAPYYQWLNASNTRLAYIQHNGSDLVIATDTGDIVLAPTGKVGIKNDTPSQNLTVGDGTGTGNQYVRVVASASDIYIGQSGGTLFGQSANSAGFVLSDNTSFPFAVGTIAAQDLILGTQNTARFRINGSTGAVTATSSITASSFVKSGGTSSQALLADGSVGTFSASNWNTAYNDSIVSAAVTGTTTKTLTLNQQDGGTVTASWTDSDTDTGITSLNGLTALTQTFAVGTSGTDFSISSSTSTHTFNLPTASATNRGALSSADWTTFNNKQNALGYTPEPAIAAGTTAQYWRGDKTWQTLNTSVVPEGTNLYFTDARARAAITLTTTGTSGAATYTSGVLNIPQYQAALTNPVTGTGNTNYITKWISGSAVGDSNLISNSAGNLGVGVTPSTATGFRYIQFGAGSALSTNNTNNSNFWHNATFDASGNALYAVTGQQSSFYRQINGQHVWAYAAAGTAGNAITFTTNMVLDASGRLGIGTTSPSEKLDIYSNDNSQQGLKITNPSSGGNAITVTKYSNGTYTHLFGALGTNYTGYGALQANEAFIYSSNQNLTLTADGVSASIKFGTGAGVTERMRIVPGGNILIGTTTDNGAKLQVNGAISIGNTVSTAVSVMSTHKVQIVINGTTYYLLATT